MCGIPKRLSQSWVGPQDGRRRRDHLGHDNSYQGTELIACAMECGISKLWKAKLFPNYIDI